MTHVRQMTVPHGSTGTAATLHEMRALVREALTDPDVRGAALRIVRPCPERDLGCQVTALYVWLRSHVKFQRDPHQVELLTTPSKQLAVIRSGQRFQGDCDDLSVLAAALGMAAGFPARFVVLGFLGPRGRYSHVYTELLGPTGWQHMDVARPPHQLSPSRVGYYPL